MVNLVLYAKGSWEFAKISYFIPFYINKQKKNVVCQSVKA